MNELTELFLRIEGAAKLGNALKTNSTLTRLVLEGLSEINELTADQSMSTICIFWHQTMNSDLKEQQD